MTKYNVHSMIEDQIKEVLTKHIESKTVLNSDASINMITKDILNILRKGKNENV